MVCTSTAGTDSVGPMGVDMNCVPVIGECVAPPVTGHNIDVDGLPGISLGGNADEVERVRHWSDATRIKKIPEIDDNATYDYIIASDILYFASQVRLWTHTSSVTPRRKSHIPRHKLLSLARRAHMHIRAFKFWAGSHAHGKHNLQAYGHCFTPLLFGYPRHVR
jgi:hypothetical protein